MNTVIETIQKRSSCRKYKSEMPEKELINQVVAAGSCAAIGMGKNPPTLVVIKNPEIYAELIRINAEIMGTTGNTFYGAPLAILVLADREKGTAVEDGSCALQNMMIAATSLGLGSCWINRARETFEREDGKALLKKMGLEDRYRGIGYLALGYPDAEPTIKDHKTPVVYVD